MMRLYVGNLGFSITDAQLESLFAEHGTVNSAKVVRRDTGKGRGFGFVEMSDGEAEQAMKLLNGKEIDGRSLTVNEAREKPQQSTDEQSLLPRG
jgi:cold-inducible RNA-binding protein